jgi:hypothetical protein
MKKLAVWLFTFLFVVSCGVSDGTPGSRPIVAPPTACPTITPFPTGTSSPISNESGIATTGSQTAQGGRTVVATPGTGLITISPADVATRDALMRRANPSGPIPSVLPTIIPSGAQIPGAPMPLPGSSTTPSSSAPIVNLTPFIPENPGPAGPNQTPVLPENPGPAGPNQTPVLPSHPAPSPSPCG